MSIQSVAGFRGGASGWSIAIARQVSNKSSSANHDQLGIFCVSTPSKPSGKHCLRKNGKRKR
jgi:hypothetical protein